MGLVNVKLLVSRATTGVAQRRGEVVSVLPREAVAMIAKGQAEPVIDAGSAMSSVESAIVRPSTVRRRTRRKRGTTK